MLLFAPLYWLYCYYLLYFIIVLSVCTMWVTTLWGGVPQRVGGGISGNFTLPGEWSHCNSYTVVFIVCDSFSLLKIWNILHTKLHPLFLFIQTQNLLFMTDHLLVVLLNYILYGASELWMGCHGKFWWYETICSEEYLLITICVHLFSVGW